MLVQIICRSRRGSACEVSCEGVGSASRDLPNFVPELPGIVLGSSGSNDLVVSSETLGEDRSMAATVAMALQALIISSQVIIDNSWLFWWLLGASPRCSIARLNELKAEFQRVVLSRISSWIGRPSLSCHSWRRSRDKIDDMTGTPQSPFVIAELKTYSKLFHTGVVRMSVVGNEVADAIRGDPKAIENFHDSCSNIDSREVDVDAAEGDHLTRGPDVEGAMNLALASRRIIADVSFSCVMPCFDLRCAWMLVVPSQWILSDPIVQVPRCKGSSCRVFACEQGRYGGGKSQWLK
ncbi:hypothetical protein KCU67_g50, partial [Aureobasidium melanogenum]